MISGEEIELGFTTFGPIFNIQLAFIAENKSALIHKIDVKLVHENNDSNLLSWEWFEETLYQMEMPERNIPTRKNQKAIAIKVDGESMVEKKIGFQHNTFKVDYSQNIKAANQKFFNIVTEGGGQPLEVKKTDEYNDLCNLFKNSFLWKKGKYTAEIQTYILGQKKPFIYEISFELTTLDIKNITPNINTCKLLIEKSFEIEDHKDVPKWGWVIKDKQ